MEKDKELFIHKFIKVSEIDKTILLLHGTGGDENDLIPLCEIIFPNTNILSLRGNVNENGMNRFFRRFTDGSFDIENIKAEVEKLRLFLEYASKEYGFTLSNVTTLGFSNGANFALNFTLLNPNIILNHVLLHPSLTFTPEQLPNLEKTKVLVTSGKRDPYLNADEKEEVKKMLTISNASLIWFEHEGGHEVTKEELDFVKNEK